MPSKSQSQHNFMAMSSSPAGRKALKRLGKKPAPKKTAKEYLRADKGKSFKK